VEEILSKSISQEQFGFLARRKIYEAMGVAYEIFHSIKVKRFPTMVIKVDLSKSCDRVSWIYLRSMLIHVAFTLNFVNWVINSVTIVSFIVLINSSTIDFFSPWRGLI
jgi:hypothetical protein